MIDQTIKAGEQLELHIADAYHRTDSRNVDHHVQLGNPNQGAHQHE